MDEEKKEVELPKTERDYMVLIGRVAFKYNDIKLIIIDILNPEKEEDKIFIDQGRDAVVVVQTHDKQHLCAIQDRQYCVELVEKVCDKINDLIATQKD